MISVQKFPKFERGIGLFEAILVSCLVVLASYAAVQAKLSLSVVAAGSDSRTQISIAVKEYSNLLYQIAGDLDVARGRSVTEWQTHIQGICTAMVEESARIANSLSNSSQSVSHTSSSNVLRVWHESFHSAVPVMNLKLTDCQVAQSGSGLELFHISVGYKLRDFQNSLQTNSNANACESGYLCERFYLSIVKPT